MQSGLNSYLFFHESDAEHFDMKKIDKKKNISYINQSI